MNLVKVKSGLLEVENFYLTSDFCDYVGKAMATKDIAKGTVHLLSNNKIERRFNYENFVIDLEKENFKNMTLDDRCMIYLGDEDNTFGIKDENKECQRAFWRIIKSNGYIQAYSSEDGFSYENIGGMAYRGRITKQGFSKFSDKPFILKNYNVYSDAFLTLLNFPKGTIVELNDMIGNLISTREFNDNMECRIFLENQLVGSLVFKNTQGEIIYESDILKFTFGDIYIYSPYDFEISYKGKIVTNSDPATLKDYVELIQIKNIGTKVNNIELTTETSYDDTIELSLDNLNFSKVISISSIDSLEIKNIYVKITKTNASQSVVLRDFQLVINQ